MIINRNFDSNDINKSIQNINQFSICMANINLPERFQKRLNENQRINGIVSTTCYEFGEILQENKLYFFEEYTDHGIRHIENVISGSDRLISETTFNGILGIEDIGYYILTVILHDLGMHLNYEGFSSLISGSNDSIKTEIDSLTWANLWDEYLHEAKLFNGKQLLAIFGNEDTIIRNPISIPKAEINEVDKKLIGEFIRRNHPRLAHEIAIKGMPGPNGTHLPFVKAVDTKVKNLIGLIARSHGMDLRKAVDHLENIFGSQSRRNPLGIHAVYLMVLLRIGDYLQIDASRSSGTLIKLKTFDSPVSEMEHNAHLAINSIDDTFQNDPERIMVTASPDTSQMYLKLKSLINSIQYELDISWAVIGEVYGNHDKTPQIKYRRITSNLEDVKFIDEQTYSPKKYSFKANDEIIKLLISPLYGNDPKFGIRELIQNAVDACIERDELEKKNNSTYKPIVNVKVFSRGVYSYFEISDNGIGMSPYEIQNYFLSAGASFRNSFEWKKKFTDEEGNSKIYRNGRFGIGGLAVFLLGTEIYVETKKCNSETGYKFNAKLNFEQIEVNKDNLLSEGTTIRIRISERVLNELLHEVNNRYSSEEIKTKWYEWYTLSYPKIAFTFLGKELLPYKKRDPYLSNKLPNDWNAINSNGYKSIFWTYSRNYSGQPLICNGIVIPETFSTVYTGLMKHPPNIVVYDNNGIMPISLNRNKISDRLSFENDLLADIYKDFIAYLLTFKNVSYPEEKRIFIERQNLNYPGLTENSYNEFSHGFKIYENTYSTPIRQLLSSKNGFILNYNYFLKQLENPNLIFIQSEDDTIKSFSFDVKENFFLFTNKRLASIEDYKHAIESKSDKTPINSRVYLKKERSHYLFNVMDKRIVMSNPMTNSITPVNKTDWATIEIGNPEQSLVNEKFLIDNNNKINFIRESELICKSQGDEIFNSLLEKYIGSEVLIPYSLNARKQKYPLAFEELSRYMEKYLKRNPKE